MKYKRHRRRPTALLKLNFGGQVAGGEAHSSVPALRVQGSRE